MAHGRQQTEFNIYLTTAIDNKYKKLVSIFTEKGVFIWAEAYITGLACFEYPVNIHEMKVDDVNLLRVK